MTVSITATPSPGRPNRIIYSITGHSWEDVQRAIESLSCPQSTSAGDVSAYFSMPFFDRPNGLYYAYGTVERFIRYESEQAA